VPFVLTSHLDIAPTLIALTGVPAERRAAIIKELPADVLREPRRSCPHQCPMNSLIGRLVLVWP
jgi:hypothetical protein